MTRILYQKTHWIPNGASEPERIKDMSPDHVVNLLGWLERRKVTLKIRDECDWLTVAAMHSGGEMAQDSLDNIADKIMAMSVDKWFESLPLIQKLRKVVAKNKAKLGNLEDACARYRFDLNQKSST
jgi:hypothetical protein